MKYPRFSLNLTSAHCLRDAIKAECKRQKQEDGCVCVACAWALKKVEEGIKREE